LISLGASIELVPAAPTVPDLVFTANAAVVLDRKALLARFRHLERQKEEVHFETSFRALQGRGLIDCIDKLPDEVVLEGAGDCVWDVWRNQFWLGYGPRSDAAAEQIVEEAFDVEVVALELANPRFYHMDTALCPLSRGEVMFVPDAFTKKGRATIYDQVDACQRIVVDVDDACRLAANAVRIGDTLVMSSCGDRLRSDLTKRGYHVVTPLCSFLCSGGSAFCLIDNSTPFADVFLSPGSLAPGLFSRLSGAPLSALTALGKEVRRRGMAWFHLPIPDVSVPDADFERAWKSAGDELRSMLKKGDDVVVHCRGGLGRAGTVTARLLVELGMEPKKAITTVRAARPGAIETRDQEKYVLNLRSRSRRRPERAGAAPKR
jgi:N-dimethylarginine dimethylaminohydrolase